jgi:YcxB-like protein
MAGEPGSGTQAQEDDSGNDDLAEHPIRGEASLGIEDFKSAWLTIPQVRRSLAWFVGTGVCTPLLIWSSSREGPGSALALVVPTLAVTLCYGLFRGRKRWAEASLEGNGGSVQYRFDDYGYHITLPGRESRMAWSTLNRSVEITDAFLIYTTPQVFTYVPKRAFAAVDQARLRQALQTRITRRAAPRGRVLQAVLLWVVLVVAFMVIWQVLL